MDNLKTILFPDPEYILVASFCYLFIFLTSHKRYNVLIINYGSFKTLTAVRLRTSEFGLKR
jgi:hypothetical protein